MKDLKLARKLLLFCGAFAVLLVVMAAAAVWQMREMNAVTEEINTDHVPQALSADVINLAASDYEVALTRLVASRDAGSVEQAETVLAKKVATIDSNYAKITATDLDPTEMHETKSFHDGWTRYARDSADVVALAKAGRVDQAQDLLRRMQPTMDALRKDLDDFSSYQSGHIEHATARAAGAYSAGWMGSLALLALAAAAVAFGYSLLNKLIARPLGAMTGALGQLAAGRRDVAVPVDAGADEVGDLARAMVALRDQLAEADRAKDEQAAMLVNSIGQALRELAEGNLTTRVTAELAGPFASLKADFNHAMVELSSVITTVSDGSSDFDGAANEIRAASTDLARRTEEQAAAIEETLAAMNQVTEMVQSTASSVGEVDRTISKAHAEASQGGEVVARAIAAMADIERSSGQVTQIVDVIDGIAFQTNLLALNAGVEAARAGDAGKGFAVVASEVRALAQRSAEAAKDIKDLIATSGEQVGQGVRLVSETGEVLDRIVGEVGKISSLANAIATSAEAQATRVHQVNAAVSEMDRMTQQNAAMVEETTAAAGSLSVKSSELAALVGRFHTGRGAVPGPVRKAAPAPAAQRAQVPRVSGNLALAPSDEDWSEF